LPRCNCAVFSRNAASVCCALNGAGARLHQVVVTGSLLLCELQGGFRRRYAGGFLLDHGLLQRDLRIEIVHGGGGGIDVGMGLRQRGPEIAIVDPRQQLTGLDRLVVADQHVSNIARDLRRDDGRIRLHIGVVGGFEVPAGGEIAVTEIGDTRDTHHNRQPEGRAPDRPA
jgi:hypothetical protein